VPVNSSSSNVYATDSSLRHALTIDVEDYFHVAAFDRTIARSDWAAFESRVEVNTDKFLDLTAAQGVSATFFFLGWVAERFPHLVRKVAAAGHEIASHGYSHALVYQQTPDTFRAETADSKKLLQDLSQQPVTGYRAASYSITRQSLWALEILQELDFSYDSSIYPILHDRYGINGAPDTPHIVRLDSGATITEFPITTVNLMGYRLPIGGGGYFRLFPWGMTRLFLRQRLRQAPSPFVFYLHPWELDPDQPRVQGAPLLSRFRHYNNLGKVAERLKALLELYNFSTMQNVLADIGSLPTYHYAAARKNIAV